MAARGLNVLLKTCCRSLALSRVPVARSNFSIPTLKLYSTSTSSKLASILDNELKLEYKELSELPKLTSFETVIQGATAVFKRSVGTEEVEVKIDANSSVQTAVDEMDEEEVEEDEPMYLPVFSVTVRKPSGDCMEFECSFDEYGEYSGQDVDGGMNAYNTMRIDSVTVVPKNTQQVETIYSTECNSLSDDLYSGLLAYLEERGVDETFATEVIPFYQVFEHQCYVKGFLEEAKKFCSTD